MITWPHQIKMTFPNAYCPDATYTVPPIKMVLKAAKWFYRKQRLKGMIWSEDYDCDNWARAFCVAMQRSHHLSQKKADPEHEKTEAVTAGEFHFISDKVGPHAIVAAFVEPEDSPFATEIFIEPQNGEQLWLTEQEQSSCFFCRF